ncbi:hypothetical protein [Granulicoccus sp. GXG6511]|uniref:hypothetical protein n=1 Tax=Granulicoccus sp. GXG6511 TaxID=3381351 RepID=UPI003D7DF27D
MSRSVFSTAGAGLTAALAVLYGLGVAFGTPLWGDGFARFWLFGGAFVVGVLFLAFIVVPGVRRLLAS